MQAVMEAMEERIKVKESEVGHYDRGRRRVEDSFGSGSSRREDSKDRKLERRELRTCYVCGERGHLKKDCGRTKKDKGYQGRDL